MTLERARFLYEQDGRYIKAEGLLVPSRTPISIDVLLQHHNSRVLSLFPNLSVFIPLLSNWRLKKKAQGQVLLKETIDVCTAFLQARILVDSFPNHLERKKWLWHMEQEHGQTFIDFCNNNKLRVSMISAVSLSIRNLCQFLYENKVHSEVANNLYKIQKAFEEIGDLRLYDTRIIENKLNVVYDFISLCEDFLETVTENKNGSQMDTSKETSSIAA